MRINHVREPIRDATDDVQFLFELIDSLFTEFHVDQNASSSSVFSNGDALTYRIDCERPNKIVASRRSAAG